MIDWDASQSDKFIGTTAAIIGLIAAGTTAGASMYAAHKTSESANTAVETETNAQKYAADLQSKASADALAFTQKQSENAYQNSETSRQGNYDQWAAGQRRLGSIDQLIGMGPREIPAYVSGVDPHFDGGGAPTGPGGAPAGGGSSAAALAAFYKSIGVAPGARGSGGTDLAYYADAIDAHGGPTAANMGYFTDRIKQDLAKAGSPGGAGPSTAPPVGSVNSYLTSGAGTAPYAPVAIAPALTMPGVQSVNSYLGR